MGKSNKINTISKNVHDEDIHVADLEQALDVAGFGLYNLKYCFVLAMFLLTGVLDHLGNAYLLPASKCDLEMSNKMRGLVASVPYIGMVVMSFFWGYLIDTRGRKPILIISSLIAGLCGIAAGFMPNLTGFFICKSISALFLACPISAPYTYMGEIVPKQYRDLILFATNPIQVLGAGLIPLYAWAVLRWDFRIDFGAYQFRPWRLLCIVYALQYILMVLVMLTGPESPKFLISQGRHDEAMAVLRTMYAANKKKAPENFPIKALKMPENLKKEKRGFISTFKQQTVPFLQPQYSKWLLLNGFLLFGSCNILNGLAIWIPEVLNRVFSGSPGHGTACEIITYGRNTTTFEDEVCNDTIDNSTYLVNGVASLVFGVFSLIISTGIKLVSKRVFLILTFLFNGVICAVIAVIRNPILFGVAANCVRLTAIAIGGVNAYSVEIFPTKLRGTAVGITMMIGRLGSIAGANVAGAMIDTLCEPMFYVFGGLLLLCSALSFLLPKSKTVETTTQEVIKL